MNSALELLPKKARDAASRQWREDMGGSFNITERLCRAIHAANEAMGLLVCETCGGEGEIEMQPSTNPRSCPDCGGTGLSPENSSGSFVEIDAQEFEEAKKDPKVRSLLERAQAYGESLKAQSENSSGVEEAVKRVESLQRFVPGMKDEGHPDGSEYPSIRPHDDGDLLRRADVLAALTQPVSPQPDPTTRLSEGTGDECPRSPDGAHDFEDHGGGAIKCKVCGVPR